MTAPKPEPLAALDTTHLAEQTRAQIEASVPTTVTPAMRSEASRANEGVTGDDLVLAWHVLHNTQALIAQAEATLAEYHQPRNKFMLSLALYDNVPSKQVAEAAGVSRASMSKILDKAMLPPAPAKKGTAVKKSWRASDYTYEQRVAAARSRNVHKYSNARAELARVAPLVWSAQLVLEEAVKYRDPAIRTLVGKGVLSQDEVAQLIGRNPSRVSHIVTGKGAGNTAAA